MSNEKTKETYSEAMENYENDIDVLSDLTTGINYEKSKDKYQENLSTAITFLLFGIAGLVVVALNIAGILKFFTLKNSSGILMAVVLSLMFIIFIVIGILSFTASRKDKKNAAIESDNSDRILSWLNDNVTTTDIDSSFDSAELTEEMKYFERSDYIKKAVNEHFDGLDDEFVDNIADQYIGKMFQ